MALNTNCWELLVGRTLLHLDPGCRLPMGIWVATVRTGHRFYVLFETTCLTSDGKDSLKSALLGLCFPEPPILHEMQVSC